MTAPTTHTLDVPGAVLTYDVRPNDSSTEPVLLMIGSPMGAAGFGTLAGYFTDRTVVTYDPRGVERSTRTDGASESTPDMHADDLHRLISSVATRPVDLFATSGGAVNALALVARHPAQVWTLVAHEPPVAGVVPDHEAALAAARDIHATYLRSGFGPAMAKFIALVMHKGLVPANHAEQPAPDPAMFGLPTEDDGSRNDPLLGQNMVSCTHYDPDFDVLRTAPTRIVIATGGESGGELAHRAGVAVADRLGTTAVTFPGGHGGFLGGEYGETGEPEAFASKLREVLDASTRGETGHVTAGTNPPDLLDDDGNASMATAIMMSHHGFRRDLASFVTALADLDLSRIEALRDEWRRLHEHLHVHHEAEDTGVFPDMRESVGNVTERLMADHQRIGPLLTRGDDAFAALPDTAEARALIAELQELLHPHMATEEAEVFPRMRGLREFPIPSPDELPLYAEGFAWASHGIAPDVIERMDAMLPDVLRDALPAARQAYAERCLRVWGTVGSGAARTPIPG